MLYSYNVICDLPASFHSMEVMVEVAPLMLAKA